MKPFLTYLRTYLLCFGMLHLSLLPGYALAQESETSGAIIMPEVVEQTESALDKQGKENSEGSNNKEVHIVDTRQAEKVEEGGMVQQLMDLVVMLGVGLLAKSLITYTPVTTDMMIAAAAGAAYIYGEISTLNATKDKMESDTFKLTHYKDGSTNNLQREALEKQKKSYEDLAEMMDTKAMLKKTAAAGFLAAAAVAYIQKAQTSLASVACVTSVKAEGVARCSAGDCTCASMTSSIASNEAKTEVLSDAPDPASVVGANEVRISSGMTVSQVSSACPGSLSTCNTVDKLRYMFHTSSNMGAKGLLISGGAGLLMKQLGLGPLAGLVSAAFTNLWGYHDKIMSSPKLRAISYGVLAGLSYTAAGTSEEQAQKMRDNAKTIQEMLNKFYDLEDSSVAQLEGQDRSIQIENGLTPVADFDREIPDEKLICGQDADEKVENGENCSSQEVRISDSIRQDKANGLRDVPSAIVNAAGQIGSVADSLRSTGGLSEGAFSDAQELSQSTQALKRLNDRIKDKLNEQRVERGEDPIDFKAEESRMAGDFKRAVIKAFDENPSDTSEALAAFGSRIPQRIGDDEDNENVAQEQSNEVRQGHSADGLEAFKMPEVASGSFDLGLDEENQMTDSPDVSYGENGETVVNVDEGLDTDGRDIVSNKEVSIFKVISVRYMKSGIPRLIDLE